MTAKKDSRNRGFEEKAHLHTDKKEYDKNYTDIFGDNKKQFCDICENRIAYCECPKDETKKEE